MWHDDDDNDDDDFLQHTKISSSDDYSNYIFPQLALPVLNTLAPSLYVSIN